MGCILCDDWVLLGAASSRQQWQAKETLSLFFLGCLCALCVVHACVYHMHTCNMTYACDCTRRLFFYMYVRSVFDCYLVVRSWLVTLMCNRAIVL